MSLKPFWAWPELTAVNCPEFDTVVFLCIATELKLTAANRDRMDISSSSDFAESASDVSDMVGASAGMSCLTRDSGLPVVSLSSALFVIRQSGSHKCCGPG